MKEDRKTVKARIRASRVNPDLKKTADLLYEYYAIDQADQIPAKSLQEQTMSHLKQLVTEKKWKI